MDTKKHISYPCSVINEMLEGETLSLKTIIDKWPGCEPKQYEQIKNYTTDI